MRWYIVIFGDREFMHQWDHLKAQEEAVYSGCLWIGSCPTRVFVGLSSPPVCFLPCVNPSVIFKQFFSTLEAARLIVEVSCYDRWNADPVYLLICLGQCVRRRCFFLGDNMRVWGTYIVFLFFSRPRVHAPPSIP